MIKKNMREISEVYEIDKGVSLSTIFTFHYFVFIFVSRNQAVDPMEQYTKEYTRHLSKREQSKSQLKVKLKTWKDSRQRLR